ncbi:undecaprenyldiphospho-muramoylpentapeptide beta-N-acetylglucosaminyltransferase [Phreatobacter aquaticus]|uniref:UDP-N-acetylglucosamine--N-acetylmuramyl-(pentapeptide) pyrophosphoryl-undecaprenol N-acetylglucosamine transferase n=1 Tax=Phreatobacter aquaticus TaxID=2570229 RepID=A0A4D7QL48_9HYPH|nr:undecaprenyldiphospho-muramoylpentapeptide beta-N-acetylglucosaminyltransferase [Phreatobacter aquaticus]QCK86086.1 undecaprenyldiphospho-muramoylpentapeptide beta-N-acetylglucosaminyltransferase [Phreatobacter aquaticus]
MSQPLVMVCAGGTGGHLFPAEALAVALAARGVAVDLVTDERAEKYGRAFPARQIHVVESATLASKNPLAVLKTVATLGRGYLHARRLIRTLRPAAVIGFGGYPTLPPMFAATHLGAPTIIHDQNAVMGRANRQLSAKVKAIATSFPGVLDRDAGLAAKATFTGNPVRPMVIEASAIPYDPPRADGPFRLCVFGGSQGARVMSEVVPAAIEAIDLTLRSRLVIVQQARGEDEALVKAAYARLGVTAEVAPFFVDLPQRLAAAHLVIGRSGASTVAELAVIGRPSILVPLPHALDQDQLMNAATLAAAEAATVVRQSDFTPQWLGQELSKLLADPSPLIAAAAHARAQGHADAADRLAELVLKTAGIAPAGPIS